MKIPRAVSEFVLSLFLVVLADVAVATVALTLIMGDKASGDYRPEYQLILLLLGGYILLMVGLGAYWKLKHRRTPRLLGVLLGILPILWLAARFISRHSF